MTFLPDLSPCTFGPNAGSDKILSVGWLDPPHSFAQGLCSLEFFRKLLKLIENPLPIAFSSLGFHKCGICQFSSSGSGSLEGKQIPHQSKREIYVPGEGIIYASPELIAHYIDAHMYLPPQEYIQAVMNCAEPTSMEYKKAILRNGGRELMQKAV